MREKKRSRAETVRRGAWLALVVWGIGPLAGEGLLETPLRGATTQAGGRTIDWSDREGPRLTDLAAVRSAALAWMPEGLSQAPIDVDLGEPVRVGGQTWWGGKYTFYGVEIGGPG